MDASAVRCPQHHRASQPSSRAIANPACMVDHLIDGGIDKTHELNLGNRPHALGCHADRDAGDHALGQRRILDAVNAKSLLQTGSCTKYATVDADIFAEYYHPGIVLELPRHGHGHRVNQRHFSQVRPRSCQRT